MKIVRGQKILFGEKQLFRIGIIVITLEQSLLEINPAYEDKQNKQR